MSCKEHPVIPVLDALTYAAMELPSTSATTGQCVRQHTGAAAILEHMHVHIPRHTYTI